MTAAGARLGLSQSAMSQAMRQLESSLGAELLDRQSRPMLPTAAGAALLVRARRLLDDARAARDAVRRAAEQPLPTLRLGLVDSFAVTVGPDLIKGLQGDAEEVRVWSGLSAQLWSGLMARDLDVLVSARSMDDATRVRMIRIYREPFMLALPPGRAGQGLAELVETLPLVRYSLRSVTGMQVERYLRRMRVDAPRRMEFDGSESVLAMVQEGLGWAITTPLCLLQARADPRTLHLAPLPSPAPRRGLFVIAREDYDHHRLDTLARRMSTLLRQKLKHALGREGAFAHADVDCRTTLLDSARIMGSPPPRNVGEGQGGG
jgi:DNA-binding transcriptional LysR family regulator